MKYTSDCTLKSAQIELTYLEFHMEKVKKRLADALEGSLVTRNIRGKTRYYYSNNGEERYLSKAESDLTNALAQKSYDVALLKLFEEKVDALKKFQEHYPRESIESVYTGLDAARQAMVTPEVPTDAQMVEEWLAAPYQGLAFKPDDNGQFFTDKGERVRSKSEIIIADILFHAGIPYKYECPLFIEGRTVYPDFTILDVPGRRVLYLEHFGMMDNQGYSSGFLNKLRMYERNKIFMGKNLIATFESGDQPLDTKSLKESLRDVYGLEV